jgi:hypothetical protein
MLFRLFTIVTAVSLVLCMATCALWARSGKRKDPAHGCVAAGSGTIQRYFVNLALIIATIAAPPTIKITSHLPLRRLFELAESRRSCMRRLYQRKKRLHGGGFVSRAAWRRRKRGFIQSRFPETAF